MVGWPISRRGRSILAAALGFAITTAAWCTTPGPLPKADLAIIRTAAVTARDHCQMRMHEDSLEFLRCVDDMLLDLPADSRPHALRRLGTVYYAWLAATAALKNGLPTADETALHFLSALRAVRLPLRIDEQQLCPAIPGDCASRNARLRLMEGDLFEADR
jgi:hypothetical protein